MPHANDFEIEMALAFCRHCPVRLECLRDGANDQWSIRGGFTAGQRETSRRHQARRRLEGAVS